MTVTAYTPLRGGIADRAIAYIQANGSTATRVLADGIGVESSGLQGSLMPCVKHGLLRKAKTNGLIVWSIGDGQAEPEEDDDPPIHRTGWANGTIDAPIAAAPAKKPEAAPLRIALWSDGVLQIQRGDDLDDVVLFTADETRALVKYLEQMAVSE